ncbi:MAG: DUF4115 domain-containing protein [Bryobacterales bacterium]|nr:DUF4115 domain-containing protein [Bryobacterales bacterium]MDE0624587.1 DUF4115 domain-containing protein [Bryobacterales bacterium]
MIGAESIGKRLKAARLEQGFSIDQVVEQTMINRDYIAALESDDHAAIPADFYAVSFLRQYSKVLGLPGDDMVSALRQKLADVHDIPVELSLIQASPASHALRAAAVEKIRRWIGEFIVNRSNAVVAATLMLVGALGWWYVGHSKTVAVATPVPGAATESQRTPEADAEVAATPGAEVSESVRPAPTSAAPVPEPAPLGSTETLAIQLRASGEVWVRVLVDGGQPQQAILQAGNLRTFRARERLQFTAGNAGAITLVVNGQVQDAIGERGQVRHVQVDRDGWKALPPGSF